MSIYANNYIVDEETGEVKLPKHLNKIRVDRGYDTTRKSWNKSGRKARIRKMTHCMEFYPSRSLRKINIEKSMS